MLAGARCGLVVIIKSALIADVVFYCKKRGFRKPKTRFCDVPSCAPWEISALEIDFCNRLSINVAVLFLLYNGGYNPPISGVTVSRNEPYERTAHDTYDYR
jgi:hypothetical protein